VVLIHPLLCPPPSRGRILPCYPPPSRGGLGGGELSWFGTRNSSRRLAYPVCQALISPHKPKKVWLSLRLCELCVRQPLSFFVNPNSGFPLHPLRYPAVRPNGRPAPSARKALVAPHETSHLGPGSWDLGLNQTGVRPNSPSPQSSPARGEDVIFSIPNFFINS